MNQEIKAKWVAALRSGKYKQNTNSCLRTCDNKFCCLGVLTDLAQKANVVSKPTLGESGRNYEYRDTDPTRFEQPGLNGGYAPYQVVQWAGLPNYNPRVVVSDDECTSLALLNDSGKHTFADLANLIEAQL